MKRVLILGRGGQLAQALQRAAPGNIQWQAWGSDELDLAGATPRIGAHLHDWRPDAVVNASAYTAVDQAEQEPDTAYRVNRDAVAEIGKACQELGARLLHVSTDFVFGGEQSRPYRAADVCRPLGVYGASKRAGEQALEQHCPDALIVRTAWLYSASGRNFMTTMLRLMNERDSLRVVADQVGTPTRVQQLAEAIWTALDTGLKPGYWHYTNAGVASWYDFAVAIQQEARGLGLLGRSIDIEPVGTEDYPTPASRPHYSVLDSRTTWQALGEHPIHWRQALVEELEQLAEDHH